MSARRRFASLSTEKPRFLCLFQRKSPHNFCTKILHRTSGDRVGRSGCRLPQISPISTDKLHSVCEESVFICRADGAICVIGKHPAGICVPLCDLWAYKTPAWPHSTFRIQHSTFHIQHSTFHIPHSTFHIQHSTFHIIHSFSRLVSEQPLRLGTYCGGSSHASPHHLWCLRTPKVRIPVPPTVVGQRFSPCSYHCFAIVT